MSENSDTHVSVSSTNPIPRLAEALAKAQAEMSEAVLDKVNPAYKNRYASLPSVLRAVKPALSRNNVFLYTKYMTNEAGARIFRTFLEHGETGETKHADCPVFLSDKPTIQAYGGHQTYAMRYNIVALLSVIADEEEDADLVCVDDDGNKAAADVKKNGWAPKITPPTPQVKAPPQKPNPAPRWDEEPWDDSGETIADVMARDPALITRMLNKDRDRAVARAEAEARAAAEAKAEEQVDPLDRLVKLAASKNIPHEDMKGIIKRTVGVEKRAKDLNPVELQKVTECVKKLVSIKRPDGLVDSSQGVLA